MLCVAWLVALVLNLVLTPLAAAQTPGPAGGLASISAGAAVLIDVTNDRILFERSLHDRRAIASLTKVMTALVALRYGKLTDEVTADGRDLPGEASIGLKAGDRNTIETLLYGMLMRSGNDAAAAIARGVGEKLAVERGLSDDGMAVFVDLMNKEAASLGMTNTQFVNPHGLDAAGQYSSAYDLALLTRQALKDPTFARMFGARAHAFAGGSWVNANRLLYQYDGLVGGKTGVTDEAGLCLIEVAERDNRRLIVVVLDAPQWYNDARALLDYGFGEARSLPAANLPRFGAASPANGPAPLPAVALTPTPAPVTAARQASAPTSTQAAPTSTVVVATRSAGLVAEATARPVYGAGEAVEWQGAAVTVQQTSGVDTSMLVQIAIGVVALIVVLAVVGLWLRTAGIGPWARRNWSEQQPADQAAPWRVYDLAPQRGHADGDDLAEEQLDDDEAGDEPVAGETGELPVEPADAGDEWEDGERETPAAQPAPAPVAGDERQADLAEAHITVAVRYVNEGRIEAAESAFIKAIQVAPEYRFSKAPIFWTMEPEGYLALAEAYLHCNRSADARAVVTLGLMTYRDHPGLRAMEERLQRERRRSVGAARG